MTPTDKKLSPRARRRLGATSDGTVAAINRNEHAARRNRRGLKRALNDTWQVLNEQRAGGAHAGGGFVSGSAQADAVAAATAAGTVGTGARRHDKKGRDGTTSPPPRPSKAARRKAAKTRKARRRRWARKIAPKNRKARAVIAAGIGLGAAGLSVARGGARVAAAGGRKVAGHASSRAQERKWTPSAAKQRWFSTTYTCAACSQDCSSAEELNGHFLEVHAGEELPVRKEAPATLVTATTRRHAGKLAVLLPPEHARKPRRRHAATARTAPEAKATAVVDKYTDNIRKIGERAVESGYARTVAQGFKAWGDQRPPQGERKWTLDDVREIFAGMQRAMLTGVDAAEMLEKTFTKPGEAGGLGMSREVTNKPFQRFRDDLATAAGDLSMIMLMIEDAYQTYIREALAKPEVDFGQRAN